jgi:hypothetical protein
VDDLVGWITGLFADCAVRAPFGIGWDLDRADPPLTARVTPADCSTARIRLRRDDVGERISFAARLQAFLDVELDRPVPPCPNHGVGLIPSRAGDVVEWRCPEGDFQARVGDYLDALWPPRPDEEPGKIAPMLAARFRRRGVSGIRRFGVESRSDCWVATLRLGPDGDEVAVRDAAAPLVVEVEAEGSVAVRSVRLQRSATETEPAHRALTLRGGAMRLAALGGQLRRARAGETSDFLVGETQVRLGPAHQVGPLGGPVVLDVSGHSFAEEGDAVCCVGGYLPTGPVRGQTPVFHAGELRVYE